MGGAANLMLNPSSGLMGDVISKRIVCMAYFEISLDEFVSEFQEANFDFFFNTYPNFKKAFAFYTRREDAEVQVV